MEREQLDIILAKMFGMVGQEYKWEFTQQPDWYFQNSWTSKQENEFRKWLSDYLYENKQARIAIMENPAKDKKRCEKAASFFVMNYGWLTKN